MHYTLILKHLIYQIPGLKLPRKDKKGLEPPSEGSPGGIAGMICYVSLFTEHFKVFGSLRQCPRFLEILAGFGHLPLPTGEDASGIPRLG